MHRLLESDFDLETQTVEQDDLLSFHGEVGRQEDDPPSRGMIDENEADHRPGGLPQQIHRLEPDRDVSLLIYGTGNGTGAARSKDILELHRSAILFRSSAFAFAWHCRRPKAGCRASNPRDQHTGTPLGALDHLSVGVVGVGQQDELLTSTDGCEHLVGLVDQGSPVAV